MDYPPIGSIFSIFILSLFTGYVKRYSIFTHSASVNRSLVFLYSIHPLQTPRVAICIPLMLCSQSYKSEQLKICIKRCIVCEMILHWFGLPSHTALSYLFADVQAAFVPAQSASLCQSPLLPLSFGIYADVFFLNLSFCPKFAAEFLPH